MLARAVTVVQEHLDTGAWREVKLVLRFLACLQGLLEGDGVFPILEELFSRAVDLQTASSTDVSILLLERSSVKLNSLRTESGFGAGQDHPSHDSICDGIFCHWF